MKHDDARALQGAREFRESSRRSFLIGSAAAAVVTADLAFTRVIQSQRDQNRILPLDDDRAAARFPNDRWVLFPGYKTSWEEGLWILNSLRPVLSRRAQMAVLGYSNRGLDINNIVATMNRYVDNFRLERLYFYGHSFGGMVAVEVAARLRDRGIPVELVLLDSSPSSRFDVQDQRMFDGVVLLYEAGVRVPISVRGTYELGERIVHKNERTWSQIVDQTLEQLSPLAPSSELIQSESSYIYHFDASRFRLSLGDTKVVFTGNPGDGVVDYARARASWARNLPDNVMSVDYVTDGALPAHASPQWNPGVYQGIVNAVQREYVPVPRGGGRRTLF
ncbi:thioesterase domain-containing protein [Arthrobacter sedimenti]|uniref:thioesterase domain-containing protein n=1 Tax=Arthrobacter sedimenti TaxID=2694931 RepID=UPI000B359E1A|nr:alpha/beta hydrolase [Arthrobacter sedimenti]OUM43380.1 alpha/beta hydrolase [Arthrobacter agilis]